MLRNIEKMLKNVKKNVKKMLKSFIKFIEKKGKKIIFSKNVRKIIKIKC